MKNCAGVRNVSGRLFWEMGNLARDVKDDQNGYGLLKFFKEI